jgi:hypothetical protein
VNEAGLADINSVPENTSLETIKRPNKIMKLVNNEGSSRKHNANRKNSWKTKSASKVVGNMMDFQLSPLNNLSTWVFKRRIRTQESVLTYRYFQNMY